MKLLYVLVFAAMLVVSTSKIRRRTWKNYNSENPPSSINIFVKTTIVYVSNLANLGIQIEVLDKCLPLDAKKTTLDEKENKEVSSASKDLSDQTNAWSSVKQYLEEGINFVCHFKDYVTEFKNYLADSLKGLFKLRRVFISRKKTQRNIIDFITKKSDSLSKYANQLLTDIKKGVQIVKTKVKETIEDVKNYMSKSIENLFSPIINKITEIKQKVKDFWNSEFMKKIRNYISECYTPMKALAGVFKAALETIVKLVLLKPDTWFHLLLKMICNWETLKKAIDTISTKTNNPKPEDKWYNAGIFVGTMIYIFSLA